MIRIFLMFIVVFSFFSASIHPAQAKTKPVKCPANYWKLVGNIQADVDRYDALVKKAAKNKVSVKELNAHINKHGLLIRLGAPVGKVTGATNRLEAEGPGGNEAGLFLKKLSLPKTSNLTFDTVYEVDSMKSKKAIREWNVPFANAGPSALEGNALIMKDAVAAVCSEEYKEVVLAIHPNGDFNVTDVKFPDETNYVEADKCPAAKALFKASDYSVCAEVQDIKTKKKRTLVWQLPMT